jgi:hypothetical protein
MRSQQAAAVLNEGVTSILVAVDLTDLPTGTYMLVLRPARDGEEWQTYPLTLHRSP